MPFSPLIMLPLQCSVTAATASNRSRLLPRSSDMPRHGAAASAVPPDSDSAVVTSRCQRRERCRRFMRCRYRLACSPPPDTAQRRHARRAATCIAPRYARLPPNQRFSRGTRASAADVACSANRDKAANIRASAAPPRQRRAPRNAPPARARRARR
jgi:hypothetical protein